MDSYTRAAQLQSILVSYAPSPEMWIWSEKEQRYLWLEIEEDILASEDEMWVDGFGNPTNPPEEIEEYRRA